MFLNAKLNCSVVVPDVLPRPLYPYLICCVLRLKRRLATRQIVLAEVGACCTLRFYRTRLTLVMLPGQLTCRKDVWFRASLLIIVVQNSGLWSVSVAGN